MTAALFLNLLAHQRHSHQGRLHQHATILSTSPVSNVGNVQKQDKSNPVGMMTTTAASSTSTPGSTEVGSVGGNNNGGSSDRSLLFAGLLASSTVFGTLALVAPFVVSRSPLPYMATPADKVRRALHFLRDNRAVSRSVAGAEGFSPNATARAFDGVRDRERTGEEEQQSRPRIFVDLGSGDGEVVYQAALSGCYDHVVGIELNYTLLTLSRCRRWFFWSRQERSLTTFLHRDFLGNDVYAHGSSKSRGLLASADTLMIFGVRPLMEQLSTKLAKECEPGTFILSYRFLLPLASDVKTTENKEEKKLLRAEIVYDEEEMRIYKIV